MKKALEILKDIRETKWCGVKQTCQNFTIADFDKAIAELEEAMKPKTCEWCSHWGNSQYDWKTERVCNKQVCGPMCKENFTDNIFGCILHEPKDNA